MIDPQLRHHRIVDIARCPEVGVVLCDVMLGWGAHPDPATALATAWQEAKRIANGEKRQIICIATVCGTREDPQDYDQQRRVLQESGIILANNNAQAIRLATAVVDLDTGKSSAATLSKGVKPITPTPGLGNRVPEIPAHLPPLLSTGPRVINLGLELFATQLTACGVPVVHADWRPPAGGDRHLTSLLDRVR
jgi:FdrA protein